MRTSGGYIQNHPLAVIWIDNEGILHKVSKNVPRTPADVKHLYSSIRTMTNGKKVCALMEVSKEGISDKETRDILKKEIPETFSALAIMSSTPLGKMIGSLIAVLAPSNIPAKVFDSEAEARKWLKEHSHLC
jgi:hypothetical protein